ncbi:MAG: PEGA domain-containing protein [Spirochaetia bacterium]
MRKTIIGVCIAMLLFITLALPAYSQAKGALTIQTDVIGARVYLNGEIAGYARPNFSILLTPGTYQVRVSMPGRGEYKTTIEMTSNAKILEVNLSSPHNYRLAVDANVRGADVYVDNKLVGQTPYSGSHPADTYRVEVSAGGYRDSSSRVELDRNRTVTFNLQPSRIQVRIELADSIISRKVHNWDKRLRVYVDGNRINGVEFRVSPGTHTIRVDAGLLTVEKDIVFDSDQGRRQTLTLSLDLE